MSEENSVMKLECPHCRATSKVTEWNKEIVNSILVGRAEELIPERLEPYEWEFYRIQNGGTVDCPECGEACVFDDMEAY